MSKFKVNEIVVLINATLKNKHSVGDEYEIISESYRDDDGDVCYQISGRDGTWTAMETSLRKKKPPEEASWEEIQRITKGWNPAREIA